MWCTEVWYCKDKLRQSRNQTPLTDTWVEGTGSSLPPASNDRRRERDRGKEREDALVVGSLSRKTGPSPYLDSPSSTSSFRVWGQDSNRRSPDQNGTDPSHSVPWTTLKGARGLRLTRGRGRGGGVGSARSSRSRVGDKNLSIVHASCGSTEKGG